MLDTCAVVVAWRSPDETVACVDALLAMTRVPDRVIVCENGSGGDVATQLADRLPRHPAVRLLVLPRNSGFAAGCNAALRASLAEGGARRYLLLNSDATPFPDALAAFCAHAAACPGIGIFGATLVHADRPDVIQAAGGCRYHAATTIHRPAHAGAPLADAPRLAEPRLDYVSGACLFVRREVFARIELFDPGYFLYAEELDLCLRARRSGFALGWTRGAVVRHVGGGSLARVAATAQARTAFANYYETASLLRLTWRHYRPLFPVAAAFRFWGKLAALAWRREPHLVPPLLAACRDFICGRGPALPGS